MSAGLKIRRQDLERTLKSIAKLAKANQRAGDAVLAFSKNRLTISLPGLQMQTEAEGILLTRVRVPARWLIELSRTLGPDDPAFVTVQGDYLTIGETTVSCTRDHLEHTMVRIPLNATEGDILRVAREHDRKEIERSGLWGLVSKAEDRRDRMINRSASILSALGVTADDLRELVDRCIDRGRAQF